MKANFDTNILIRHLRGETRAHDFLRAKLADPDEERWIGAMQRAEILFFMRPNEEDSTMRLLSLFFTAPVDQYVVDEASRLYRQWHARCGIDINDAVLAATARRSGGKIYTLNNKHFSVPDLHVESPW